ncbi:hypothetical protein B0T16DRAFT_384211 [Cercophora newfieldiana]|uniref:F-box domain-containing protein n=1 Tax=Cercophora newfieldiana TaxID=92897 RepID=A0AA39YMI0_9PEZI|nr:hypothetical protein B0T16DRAFT_384211 [Cercophora newfieldiana]
MGALPTPQSSLSQARCPALLADLDPRHIAILQRTSRTLRTVCLNENIWRQHCFEKSPFLEVMRKRRAPSLADGCAGDRPVEDVAATHRPPKGRPRGQATSEAPEGEREAI